MKSIAIGGHSFWVPEDAAEDCLRVAAPVMSGDEYILEPLRRGGHWPQYFVDVGGNAGAFAVKVADTFPGATILACEPFGELADCYEANTKSLPATIYLHRVAAVDSDVDSVEYSVVENDLSGWAGNFVVGSWQPPYHAKRTIMVPSARLSELLLSHRFPRIDVLKIDCEGSEAAVLEDLKKSGWLTRTRWVRYEWHGQENRKSCLQLLSDTHIAWSDDYDTNGFGLAHALKDTPHA